MHHQLHVNTHSDSFCCTCCSESTRIVCLIAIDAPFFVCMEQDEKIEGKMVNVRNYLMRISFWIWFFHIHLKLDLNILKTLKFEFFKTVKFKFLKSCNLNFQKQLKFEFFKTVKIWIFQNSWNLNFSKPLKFELYKTVEIWIL